MSVPLLGKAMIDLNSLVIFATVVDASSFSEARAPPEDACLHGQPTNCRA